MESRKILGRAVNLVGTIFPSEAVAEYFAKANIQFDPNYITVCALHLQSDYFSDDALIAWAKKVLGRFSPFEVTSSASLKIERGDANHLPVIRGAEIIEKIRYDLHEGYSYLGAAPKISLQRWCFRENVRQIDLPPLKEMEFVVQVHSFSVEKDSPSYADPAKIIFLESFSKKSLPSLTERQYPSVIAAAAITSPEAERLRTMASATFESRPIFLGLLEVDFNLYEVSPFVLSQLAKQAIASIRSEALKADLIPWSKAEMKTAEQLLRQSLTESILCERPNFAREGEFVEQFNRVISGHKTGYFGFDNGHTNFYTSFCTIEFSFLIHDEHRLAVFTMLGED